MTNVGDRLQRFEVSCLDHYTRQRKVLGWCNNQAGVDALVKAAEACPSWIDVQVRDRQAPPPYPDFCFRESECRGLKSCPRRPSCCE